MGAWKDSFNVLWDNTEIVFLISVTVSLGAVLITWLFYPRENVTLEKTTQGGCKVSEEITQYEEDVIDETVADGKLRSDGEELANGIENSFTVDDKKKERDKLQTCKTQVETRYHYQECDDFDLCVSCYNNKMIRLGLGLEDGSASTEKKNMNMQEDRRQSIQRCIQIIMHAAKCRDANCRLGSCSRMKKVLSHSEICKKKNDGGCFICKELMTICFFHARNCKDQKCVIPYCYNIEQKLKHGEGNPSSLSRSSTPQMIPPHLANQAVRPPMAGNPMGGMFIEPKTSN